MLKYLRTTALKRQMPVRKAGIDLQGAGGKAQERGEDAKAMGLMRERSYKQRRHGRGNGRERPLALRSKGGAARRQYDLAISRAYGRGIWSIRTRHNNIAHFNFGAWCGKIMALQCLRRSGR